MPQSDRVGSCDLAHLRQILRISDRNTSVLELIATVTVREYAISVILRIAMMHQDCNVVSFMQACCVSKCLMTLLGVSRTVIMQSSL